jgi:hypothetical protein
MAWGGMALGFLALAGWVAALPLPGLDWMVAALLSAGAGLSLRAALGHKKLGVIALGVNGVGLILLIVLSIT